jgi:hypothetical protein
MLSACWISLSTEGQTGYKSCLVTIDTGVTVILVSPDIIKTANEFTVHTTSGDTSQSCREHDTLGWHQLTIWIFDANSSSMSTMHLEQKVPLWRPRGIAVVAVGLEILLEKVDNLAEASSRAAQRAEERTSTQPTSTEGAGEDEERQKVSEIISKACPQENNSTRDGREEGNKVRLALRRSLDATETERVDLICHSQGRDETICQQLHN